MLQESNYSWHFSLTEQLNSKVFDNLIQKHFELKNSTLCTQFVAVQ